MRSNIKSILICFFDQNGIVHKEFVPPGQTDNAAFYVEVLKHLQEIVRRKRPDQWRNNIWLLHYDNAPSHAALLTRRFLTDNMTLADSGKWNCERCKWERLCLLEVKLEKALIQIAELKMENKKLEEQLRLAGTGNDNGRQDTVQNNHKVKQCLVVGDSIIRNVETGQNNMKAACFPGVTAEQLHRVLDSRDLRTPDTVIIDVGTNDLKRVVNLDYVIGELYSLVDKAKVKFPQSRIVLSGVLRRTDVSW